MLSVCIVFPCNYTEQRIIFIRLLICYYLILIMLTFQIDLRKIDNISIMLCPRYIALFIIARKSREKAREFYLSFHALI